MTSNVSGLSGSLAALSLLLCCAGSFSAPQLHKASPEPIFHSSPRMRPGTMPKQKYLQHLAFAFVAGGLLTYLCVTLLGRAGTLDAKGDACVNFKKF